MYHILKLCTNNSYAVSTTLNKQLIKRTCSLCGNQYIIFPQKGMQVTKTSLSSRFHSTNVDAAELTNETPKKKRRRVKKKYAELLEVTENSSTERKASVSKLKTKFLSELVHNPAVSLSELHTLKTSKLNSKQVAINKNNQTVSDGDLGVYCQDDIDACNLGKEDTAILEDLGKFSTNKSLPLDDSEFLHNLDNFTSTELQQKLLDDFEQELEYNLPTVSGNNEGSNFPSKKKPAVTISLADNKRMKKGSTPTLKTSYKHELREKLAKIKLAELEAAGREESLFQNTYCYIEACAKSNMLNRGLAALISYRIRHRYPKRRLHKNAVNLYNTLLQAFAQKGNLSKVNEIMYMFREDKIHPTTDTYAACLDCIGRIPDSDSSRQQLTNFIEELKNNGFTLQDVFINSVFISDQRERILEAIRRIETDFVPMLPDPDTHYSCCLLEDLNKTEESLVKSPAEGILGVEQLKDCIKQQIGLEMGTSVKVKSIEKRTEPSSTIHYYKEKLEEAQENWRKVIKEAFERDVEVLRAKYYFNNTYRSVNLYPFLKILEPEQYVEIIMQEIRKLAEGSETFSPTMLTLHRELAKQVKSRYIVKHKEKNGVLNKVENLYIQYCDWYLSPRGSGIKNTREKWQHLIHMHQDGPSVNTVEKAWPMNVLNGIGKFLYKIILNDIKIDVNVIKPSSKNPHYLPAFYSLFRYHGRLLKEEVKPHPILSRLFRGAAQTDLVFDVTMIPMLCPPVPWTAVSNGGYLVAKANFMRLTQENCQQLQRLEESPVQQLYPIFDSLNQLGSIPWMVNKPVLDVVIHIFNNGGQRKLDIPEPPSACPAPDAVTPQMTQTEKYHVYVKRMALRRKKAEMYSLWCDTLYRLSLANHFRDKVFWLPHNLDFRGRVYPCPPHFNHLGSDMARSLLQFAKGEPLGPNGLKWLKIHIVNLTGLKKKNSLEERLQFAEELMPEILDSAENPLTGRMWWAKSEEPWQTLACCMEIAKAVHCDDPESYVCHFPVHQDGSCNGLQHYAALGRDTAGAESVNLCVAQKPQDVYDCVAQLVERERSKEAENGLKLAQALDGFVRRKVIKQTVMTTVYGVTRFGARLQIARQLKDLDDFPKDCVWPASSFLATKTFESLREMFTSAKEIQDWFTECARLISLTCGQNVEWVTPLGLPVVQPYYKLPKNQKLKDSKVHDYSSVDMFERPNVMKQKNAFPPNFIHSLDSSHMMLTSLFCERKNITFVSVHDCYWTHPSTVDIMNKICREQFVALHSQPILESLSTFMVKKYGYAFRDIKNDGSASNTAKQRLNNILRQVPPKGDFNLENVLDSVYFFS